ncbi:MAG: 3-phosphoserine/phosphohydroxythreonine transaminase, partial [Oscillospiraceae bacterium]
ALTEAKRWCAARAVTSSKEDGFSYVPELKAELVDPDAAYVHITANNTIYGTMYREIPQNLPAPLACDMSSIILGKQFDVRDFGLIYAGAQKNMGPAGLTVVIVRRDLIPDDVDSVVPSMLQYKSFADSGSMYNTPPCYSIYIAGLVYEHIEREGGVAEFERRNRKKAELLYDCIDNSDFFGGTALFQDRSIMNVTFTLANAEQTDDFVAFAKARGIIGIKGHRAVGGCRASIYNAMPQSGVEALVECMKEYESKKA